MSPIRRTSDFRLNNNDYMLARKPPGGRSWYRTGQPDTPGRRSDTDAKYGVVDDRLDHPTVYDDWSGGFGHAYRRTGENTYHWAEGIDARFPRQLIHAQAPHLYVGDGDVSPAVDTSVDAEGFLDLPYQAGSVFAQQEGGYPGVGQPGQGAMLLMGRGWASAIMPVDPAGVTSEASMWVYYSLPMTIGPTTYGESLNYGYQAAIFDGDVFLPNLNGTSFFGANDKDFGAFDLSEDMPGRAFATVGDRLWRAHGPTGRYSYYVQSAVLSPLATVNWTATISVGNRELPIVSLIGMEDQLFAGEADGLYAGDSTGTFVNVLGNLQNQIHEDNCRDLTIYNGGIVTPHISGLWWYKPNEYAASAQEIGPPKSDRSPIRGHIRTVRSFGAWLYAGLSTGSVSYLLAGQANEGGAVWHPLLRFPHNGRVHRLHFDGITRCYDAVGVAANIPNRCWAAMNASINTAGTAPIYYWPIPSNNGNPLATEMAFSPNYIGSARIDMGAEDWGAPGTPKMFRAVEVWADNLASGYQYGDIYYDVDQAGSFGYLGRVQESPKSTLYFPDDLDATQNDIRNPRPDPDGSVTDYAGYAADMSGSLTPTSEVITDPGTGMVGLRAIQVAYEFSLAHRCNFTARVGTYTFTGYVRVNGRSDADITVGMGWGDDGDYVWPATTIVTDAVDGQWYPFTWTAPSATAADTRSILIKGVVPTSGAFNVQVANLQAELGAATSYCDGERKGAYWTGTPHASTSIRVGGFASGQSIELSLRSFTASPAITPVYRSIVLRGALMPNSIEQINAVVRIADNMRDRSGSQMRSGARMIQELRDLADPAITPGAVQLIDLAGATCYVKMVGMPVEQELYQTGSDEPELAVTIQLAVMTFS